MSQPKEPSSCTPPQPQAIYVWLVPSEHVLEQPGSWRIRKWDTAPFPEANYTLAAPSETKTIGADIISEIKAWQPPPPDKSQPHVPNIFTDDDHDRGCAGRHYTCTCGYDDKVIDRGAELERKLAAPSATKDSVEERGASTDGKAE